jgi:hypothetical protein
LVLAPFPSAIWFSLWCMCFVHWYCKCLITKNLWLNRLVHKRCALRSDSVYSMVPILSG